MKALSLATWLVERSRDVYQLGTLLADLLSAPSKLVVVTGLARYFAGTSFDFSIDFAAFQSACLQP